MSIGVQKIEKYGCKIVTCEPATRRIEGVIKSGAVVQIAVYTVDPLFRWPVVGENWIIRRENGTFILDSLWQEPGNEEFGNQTTVNNLDPGDVIIDVPTGKIALTTGVTLATDIFAPTSLTSSLPATPVNGQIIYYQNPTLEAEGVVWQFRYRSTSSSSYKWEFIGGSAWAPGNFGSIEKITESAQELPGGPILTVPVSGIYDVGFSIRMESLEASARTLVAVPWVNGVYTGMHGLEDIGSSIFMGADYGAVYNRVALLAGEKVSIGISQSGIQAANFEFGWLSLCPVRI